MKRLIALFLLFLFALPWRVQSQSWQEFQQRRELFRQKMAQNSAAIFKNATADQVEELADYRFRSKSNFFYLTGWSEPDAILILFKQRRYLPAVDKFTQEILLLPKTQSRQAEQFNGPQNQAAEEMGFTTIATLDKYENILEYVFSRLDSVYLEMAKVHISEPLTQELELIRRARERLLNFAVLDPKPILMNMRRIKSPAELAKIERAVAITCQAYREMMRSAEPGMYEYELAALLEYVFQRNGAMHAGFTTIVGSGANALIAHYDKNTRQTQAGDLVVVDSGAEFEMYTADITRTIPISGKFSPAQARIYQIVLEAQQTAILAVKPGATFNELNEIVHKVLQKVGFDKYLYHGISHSIGLAVHDNLDPSGTLAAGMVITIEPGLYLPAGSSDLDSAYWNIGIRIEDDVLVTPTGYRVLSDAAPKTISEIEALMSESGIGNQEIH